MKAKKLLMQLAASCWLFVATAAHALPPQDERHLVSVLDNYSKQALREDFSQLGEVMPPALIEVLGQHLQLPREKVLQLLVGSGTVTVEPDFAALSEGHDPRTHAQRMLDSINKAQQAQIHKLAIEVGVSLDRVLSYFGVAELKDIAASDFLRVIRSLEKRRQAA